MKGKGDKQGLVLCWREGSRVRAKRTNGVNWRVKVSEIELRREVGTLKEQKTRLLGS